MESGDDDPADTGETARFEHVSLGGSGDADRDFASELVRRLSGRGAGFSRYALKGEVARGGQGAILRVWDEDLRRSLAMKVTLAGAEEPGSQATDSRTLGRFLEEAQVTGQLDHPGIVPVHELGLDADGRVYFTMKLVRGRDLRTILRLVHEGAEGWNLTRALGVMLKVCEAMAYAHAKGVIHRDLKPGNVMVGRYGEVYVMDWGLARVIGAADHRDIRIDPGMTTTGVKSDRRDEAEDVESPLLTMDGDVVGTPAYMPPEQALGDLEAMGPHSDVYAVGAMLYHLLAGRVPYVEPGMRINNHVIWYLVQKGPPEPLEKVARDVPAELAAICEKAMARDAGARYADMQALADDLRAYLEGRVVAAYETGAVAEFKKWVRRNRPLAASLLAALLLALGGLAATSYVQARGKRQLGDANETLRATNEALAEAKGVAEKARATAEENEREARWQSYVANIGAANGRLDAGAAADAAARLAACPPEHRGWEWRYLENRVDASLASREVSPNFLWSVAWSPDGRLVAAGHGPDGDFGAPGSFVSLHDAETLATVRELEPVSAPVWALTFSPTGTEVCAGTALGEAFVWDVESGERVAHWAGVDAQAGRTPFGVAYHPDGLRIGLATWSELVLWDPLTNRALWTDRQGPFRCLAFSPDGTRLAAGLASGWVRSLDVESGRDLGAWNLTQIDGDEDTWKGVLDLEYSDDGKALLAATGSGVAVRLEEGGAFGDVYRGHRRPATGACFGLGGETVLTSSLDGTVRIWDAASSELLEVLHGHDGFVSGIDLSPDRDRIVSASFDRTLRVWDALPGSVVTTLAGSAGENFRLYALAFDASGDRLAWLPTPNRVQVVDARSGLELFQLPPMDSILAGMAFADDGRLLTIHSGDKLRVWDSTGALLDVVGEPENRGRASFSPDRTMYVSCVLRDDGPWIAVRSTSTGELVRDWHVEAQSYEPRFTPDGRRVVASLLDGQTPVFDIDTGELVRTLELPPNIGMIDVDPSGTLLASVAYDPGDPAVRIHDLRTGELVRRLEGHALPATVAFAPDGRQLLVGNWYEGSMTIFDVERGEVVSLYGLRNTVRRVAFSPDGRRIASAETGGLYHVWETTSAAERSEARRHAARERVLEERARPIVEALFERAFMPEDVEELLRADASLPDDVRATAIRLARVRGIRLDTAEAVAVSIVLLDRDRPAEDYRRALSWLEATHRIAAPVEAAQPYGPFKGLALYRLGRYEEAAELLRNPARVHRARLLALALAEERLGHHAKAEAALAEARTFMSQAFTGSEELEVWLDRLFEEAEKAVEGG